MPTIPCPTQITCPCDTTPLLGLSVEAPDVPNALAVRYAHILPNLGNTAWTQTFCIAAATGPDQTTADLLAQRDAEQCVLESQSGGGGGPGVFFNTEQQCSVLCPDGLPFTFTVPAGLFIASTQMAADAQANAYACNQAAMRQICLSALSGGQGGHYPVANQYQPGFTTSITATGQSLAGPGQTNNWAIVSGSLPPGLVFHGGALASNTVTIDGTPTVSGTFNFSVECTDPSGDTMIKPYTIGVSPCLTSPEGYHLNANTGWTQIPASPPFPPYDTGYQTAPNTPGPYHIQIQFHTPSSKTWNWVARVDSNPFPTGFVVTVNGTAQTMQPDGFGLWQATGSFTTQDCVPNGITVIDITGDATVNQAAVEWQTP